MKLVVNEGLLVWKSYANSMDVGESLDFDSSSDY